MEKLESVISVFVCAGVYQLIFNSTDLNKVSMFVEAKKKKKTSFADEMNSKKQ